MQGGGGGGGWGGGGEVDKMARGGEDYGDQEKEDGEKGTGRGYSVKRSEKGPSKPWNYRRNRGAAQWFCQHL